MCSVLQDIDREVDQLQVDIADCDRWRDRFYDAIHQGSVLMVRTDNSSRYKASGESTFFFLIVPHFVFLLSLLIIYLFHPSPLFYSSSLF
jgi:hypothetical protein